MQVTVYSLQFTFSFAFTITYTVQCYLQCTLSYPVLCVEAHWGVLILHCTYSGRPHYCVLSGMCTLYSVLYILSKDITVRVVSIHYAVYKMHPVTGGLYHHLSLILPQEASGTFYKHKFQY